MEIALFTVYWMHKRNLFNRICSLNTQGYLFTRLLTYFFIISIGYLLFSYTNIAKFWKIENLRFDTSYIYRHFMIVVELALATGIGHCLFRTNLIFQITKKQITILTLASCTSFYLGGGTALTGLLVGCISLMALLYRKKTLLIFTLVVLTDHSSFIISSAILILTMLFMKQIFSIFSKGIKTKIYAIIILSFFIFIVLSSFMMEIITKDPNSIWRLIVWTNEIKSLADTAFTGVGFGTAYVTTNISKFTDNTDMYFGNAREGWAGLFLVANHNTFLNMFYRMGVVGGILFLTINVSLIAWCMKCYQKASIFEKRYVGWALANFLYQIIIILLNPGLEMLQFAINYTFFTGILIAVMMHINKKISLITHKTY